MKCSSGDDCGGANAVRHPPKQPCSPLTSLLLPQMLVFDASCTGAAVANYQECLTPDSKAHKFCDATLSAEARLADLVQVGAQAVCAAAGCVEVT